MSERVPQKRSADRAAGGGPKSRKKLVVSFIVTVAVLALVIIVGSALSEPERTEVVELPSLQEQAVDLYGEALSKLQSGDTTGALELLQEAAILDPGNEEVENKLQEVRDSRQTPLTPSNNSGNGSGTNSDPDPDPDPIEDPHEGFLDPVDELASLLPGGVSGFRVTATSSDAALGIAQATLDPVPGGDYDQRVSRVLVTVHDKETKAAAAEYLDRASERLFPSDSQTLTVDGIEVYFGTDGGRGATATFYRGRYVFEAILSADQDIASALSDVGKVIAASFPDSLD